LRQIARQPEPRCHGELCLYYKNDDFVERNARGTRLETIVDASFAFALTMLIISVGTIPRTHDELVVALKGIPAFAASFVLIINFWLGHYRWTRRYGIEDARSVTLSLLLIFTVLVFLYPLKMMMFGAFNFFSGGYLPSPVALTRIDELVDLFASYALGYIVMSLTLAALFRYALRSKVEPPLSPVEVLWTRFDLTIWLIQAGVGIASLLIAWLIPRPWSALAPWPYALLGILLPILATRAHRNADRLKTPVTSAPAVHIDAASPP
jgi:uncharacterized membrane protein